MKKGNRLRVARILNNLTQLELARQVATTELTISRIETGRIRPSAELKQRIAELLGKPTYELFDS